MTMHYDFARYLNIRSANSPVVSADGTRVAFLSDITGNFQVWSVALESLTGSSWPRQLTNFPDKVWEIHGTKSADHLIAVSDSGGNERQQFFLITNFGVDRTGVAQHEVCRITEDDSAIHRFGAWSEDGQSILYTSNARNKVDFDIYQLELHSGQPKLIQTCLGRRQVLGWLSNDRYVLSADAMATEQIELYLLDLSTGAEQHLTRESKPARYGSVACADNYVYLLSDCFHDRGALCALALPEGTLTCLLTVQDFESALANEGGELEHLCISSTGDTAAVTLNRDGYSHLFLVQLGKRLDYSTSVESLRYCPKIPLGVIDHLSFGGAQQSLYFDFQSPVAPQDVWSLDPASGQVIQVTHSDHAGIDAGSFIKPESIHFQTFDGRMIPAYLYRPQPAPPSTGYPCIVYVHGGPAGQQRPDFDVRFQYFLNEGYTLMVPNVRGSTGYGRTYMMLDDVDKRMESVADLQAAVRWLHGQADIDRRRIVIYGRSYGGFMVLAALTEYPELFAAGIDVVGIADWETFLERTSPWRRGHREREYGSLAEHRDLLRRISPIHKADRISAPLLVIAGDNDPRVPLFESQQIVERVQSAGGQVEFVHYADEGHKISKLANRIDSFNVMSKFLQHHVREWAE